MSRPILCVPGLSLLLPIAAAHTQVFSVEAQTRRFLDAYAGGDAAIVQRMVDPRDVVVYGSDAAEFARGAEALLALLRADQQLWGGRAKIGPMQRVSVVESGTVATIFFEAPFTAGQQPAVLVRFCMVWRREHGRWLLVQSANSVPTEHQSAGELLNPRQ